MKNKLNVAMIALLLAVCLLFSACGSKSAAQTAPTEQPAAEAAPAAETASAEEAAPAAEAPAEPEAADADAVRVLVLNGTTGFGMAGLMAKSADGNAAVNYSFGVETDPSNIAAALISGECDIAALPTNAAAALYNKTQGQVRVLALNTRGVLYLMSDGMMDLKSFADLDGRTVYVPAQNPSFIFAYLCQANGVNVTIDNTYPQAAELSAALASGKVELAVLPEPMVTASIIKNTDLMLNLDLTAEWNKVAQPGSLVQGCVVVRSAFADAHPEELAAFLAEYEESVNLLSSDISGAVQKIEAAGIFPQAAIAERAIPHCNVCFVTGEQMKSELSAFLQIMFEAAPQSIGGALPADDFYCILK